MKNPTCILTGDWHLQEKTPMCRTDDYWKTQTRKVEFISDLQQKYGIPILHGGDLFDKWKASPRLESWAIKNLPEMMYVVSGNHDQKNHNLDLMEDTSINVLKASGKIKLFGGKGEILIDYKEIVSFFSWGTKLHQTKEIPGVTQIAVLHYFTYMGETWPGNKAPHALKLLRDLYSYDLILTSDNHIPFVVEEEGRLLVNPGSLMRTTTKQIDHKPRVYLYDAITNTVEPVYIPIEENVIDTSHIEKQQERDGRIDAFIKTVIDQEEVSFDFRDNVKNYFKGNKEERGVELATWECLEEIVK